MAMPAMPTRFTYDASDVKIQLFTFSCKYVIRSRGDFAAPRTFGTSRTRRFHWRCWCTASRTPRTPGGISVPISSGAATGSSRRGCRGMTRRRQADQRRNLRSPRARRPSRVQGRRTRGPGRPRLGSAIAGYGAWRPTRAHSAASSRSRFRRSPRWRRRCSVTPNSSDRSTSGSSSRSASQSPHWWRPGFWESLWADWSPGYDAAEDIARATPTRHRGQHRQCHCAIPRVVQPAIRRSRRRGRSGGHHAATAGADAVPARRRRRRVGADMLADVDTHLPADGSVVEIVDGVGHFLHLEQPELIAAKISDWLAGLARRPPWAQRGRRDASRPAAWRNSARN